MSTPCEAVGFGSLWQRYSLVGKNGDSRIEVRVKAEPPKEGSRFQKRVEAYKKGEGLFREEAKVEILKAIDSEGYVPCNNELEFDISLNYAISNADVEKREWLDDDSYLMVASIDTTYLNKVIRRK